MSVLIKGMTMPKRCGECIFDVSGVGGCIINLNTEPKNKLTHSCPLIAVPSHGDLIDKDELSKLVGESFEYFLARLSLKCPKAVIPAERSEE